MPNFQFKKIIISLCHPWHRPIPYVLYIKTLLKGLSMLLLLLLAIVAIAILSLDFRTPAGLMPVNNQHALVIDNVNIVKVKTNQLLRNKQLVIKDGRITAINEAKTPTANNVKVVDAQGAFITPGLFDMHVHLHDRKYLMLNLAYGVTSVRNLRGQNMHLRWKHELQNNEWLGSNLHLSSPVLAGAGTHELNEEILTPQEAKKAVNQAKENGYDFIKVYGYLAPDIFEAIIKQAREIDFPVAKHGPHPAKGSDWSYIEGLQSLEHVEDIFQGPLNYQYDQETMQSTAIKIKATNVPVVPTLATFNHLTQLSNGKQTFIDSLDLDYLNPLYFDIESEFSITRWLNDNEQQSAYHLEKQQHLFNIVKVLNEYKVKLLVGSDAGTMYSLPGISTHNEMQLLKRAGLSNHDVLKAATINAAETLAIASDYGSITTGKVADLVLVSTNPLDDIQVLSNPFAVVKNGQWLDSAQLEKLKVEAKNTNNYFWSVMSLIEDLLIRAFN